MHNGEIIPSILANTEEEFVEKLRLVGARAKTVHVDALNGTLFGARSWYDAQKIAKLNFNALLELHLMVSEPLPIIKEWKSCVKNFARAIIHAESAENISELVNEITALKLKVGIAINPETPISAIAPIADSIESVLIMSVHPGASGQKFLGDDILKKIQEARALYPNLTIICDGGITLDNINAIKSSGCDKFVVASAIFSTPDPIDAFSKLNTALGINS